MVVVFNKLQRAGRDGTRTGCGKVRRDQEERSKKKIERERGRVNINVLGTVTQPVQCNAAPGY